MITTLWILMLFWSGERTYLLDTDEAQLTAARGWITSGPEGITRYRLNTHATRQERHTRLEILKPGAARFAPLAQPATLEGGGEAEEALLQFQGDQVTWARFKRDGAGRHIALSTLALPSGAARPLDPDAVAALRWVSARLPGALEGCPLTTLPTLQFRAEGGARVDHLRFGDIDCPGLPPVFPAPARGRVEVEGWDVEARTLNRAGAPPITEVADARALPDGHLLVLTGPPLPFDEARSGPLDYSDPRIRRALRLHRPSGEIVELGEIHRIDGARVLAADDPLVEARAWLLAPLDARCYATTTPVYHEEDPRKDRREALEIEPPPLLGHLCRTEPQAEAGWDHPDDLSVGVRVDIAEAEATLTVLSNHPEEASYDFWLGGYRRVITVTPKGIKRRKRHKNARLRRVEGGVQLTVLQSQLGDPPALNVRVEANGHAMWALGAPVDNRNRTRTPLALEEPAE